MPSLNFLTLGGTGGLSYPFTNIFTLPFSDTFSASTIDPRWTVIDRDTRAGTYFSAVGGELNINSNGINLSTVRDQFGAVYNESVSGNFTATVKIISQEVTRDTCKAGIMVRNYIPGLSNGYIVFNITPSGGYERSWDSNGDGYIDTTVSAGVPVYPSWLRIFKIGNTFYTGYSYDGIVWVQTGFTTLSNANDIQDVGLFVCSKSEGFSLCKFDDWNITSETPVYALVTPDPLIVKINTNDVSVIGHANIPVDTLIVRINTNDVSVIGNALITPDPLIVRINTNDVLVIGNALVTTDTLIVRINTNDVSVIGNALITPDPLIVRINTNDASVVIHVNVYPDPLIVRININDVSVVISTSVIVDSLILIIRLIEPLFTTEISEYDQFPACPRDIFGDWFQEDKQVYDREKELIAMWHMESYNMFGVPMLYYASTYDVNYDRIFGEDNNRRYIQVYDIMSYYRLPREDKLWSKFGIDGIDEITMYISKEHFQYVTSALDGVPYIPKSGDIIKAKYNNHYYEVVTIKEEAGMFLQSKRYSWELIVRVFRDQHITAVGTPLATDPIAQVSNKMNDLFNRVQAINSRKTPILYQTKPGEKPKNDPFGTW